MCLSVYICVSVCVCMRFYILYIHFKCNKEKKKTLKIIKIKEHIEENI